MGALALSSQTGTRPNVLLLIIDDCPPDVVSLTGDRVARTPNMRRLAQRGVTFTKGYCAAPACGPSRAAMLTGLQPSTMGVYQNDQSFRDAKNWVKDVVTMPEHFKANGYLTAGFGKVFHSGRQTDQNRHAYTGGYFSPFVNARDKALEQFVPAGKKVTGSVADYTWGPLPDDFDRPGSSRKQQDTEHADRAISLLKQNHGRPFFCATGFYRPHVHWFVPQRFYDLYPPEKLPMPEGLKWDDLDDLPPAAQWFLKAPTFHNIHLRGLWKQALQALYASITYVDDQIGRVLDALDSSPHKDNTIVVFVGDNGWHTGQKHRFSKFALWELACRVPFVISVPGVPSRVSQAPVSMLDLYPTLASLCELPVPSHSLEGADLAGVLRRKQPSTGRPVLSTMGLNNHSLRDERYRYIRYSNGDEELYDHETDPHEWKNLAGDPRHEGKKRTLAAHLPKSNAPDLYESEWTRRWQAWMKDELLAYPE
jgi:arylsulfatase A-like enzyme